MEKREVEYIADLSVSEADKVEKEDLCKGCGLWPCYAEAPECLRYNPDQW